MSARCPPKAQTSSNLEEGRKKVGKKENTYGWWDTEGEKGTQDSFLKMINSKIDLSDFPPARHSKARKGKNKPPAREEILNEHDARCCYIKLVRVLI